MTHILDTLSCTLEEALDKDVTLKAILETLSIIATFKSEHIESSYQDIKHAGKWDKLAARLDTLSASEPVKTIDKLLIKARDNS